MRDLVGEIVDLLRRCTPDQRHQVFNLLRREFPIHPLEATWNTQAEVILEAIRRSPDITQRGVRGIVAEAVFSMDVVEPLLHQGWEALPIEGEQPYDVHLRDALGSVRIQIKMQRLTRGQPTTRRDYPGMYVVETQRTRTGQKQGASGEETVATRPYRFGDFDILAVSLHPSSGNWSSFLYTVASWLLPRPDDPRLLRVFQPVPRRPNADWTDDILQAVDWFRSGRVQTIGTADDSLPSQDPLGL